MTRLKVRCECGKLLTMVEGSYLPDGRQVCRRCWERITGKQHCNREGMDEKEVED